MSSSDDNKPANDRLDGHSLTDHLYGDEFDHEHGPDADHDHDSLASLGPLEENPIWIQDNVILNSVGMDIGSSGTQVIFSRVHMRRISEDLTSRYIVVKRETLYQSPVQLTPYRNDTRIDDEAVGRLIDEAYGAAGIGPEDIDTGVVILTGEALRRENAEGIAQVLASQGGEFVCATAGHHMEAMLAAYGSGSAKTSYDLGKRLLNVDIGGGTTKLAIVEGGVVLATAAIHIGGRLQVTDKDGRITRLDPAGRHHARQAGFDWNLGDSARPDELDKVARLMAETLTDAFRPPLSDRVKHLYLTDPITDFGRIDGVIVSGGVGEYVYGREERDFGDMGKRLGAAFRAELDKLAWPLLPATACIRATALGASEYTIQLSGNTGHISSPGRLLPRRNIQVVQPSLSLGPVLDRAEIAAAIHAHLTAFDLAETTADVALALRWEGAPEYSRVRAFAEAIRNGLAFRIANDLPIYVMLDGDVAMTLGRILAEELGVTGDLLVIDGVQLRDFDYIDLGKIRLPSRTVPVTIKSLVFNEDPRGPRPRQRLHHHEHDHDHVHDHAHDHHHDHHHHHGHHDRHGDHGHDHAHERSHEQRGSVAGRRE
jgi:ethanolamine utilization protein EutA